MIYKNAFCRNQATVLFLSLILAINAAPASAQSGSKSGPLGDGERSSIMFDIDLKQILSHPSLEGIDLQQMMQAQGLPGDPGIDISKVNRVFGGFQLPPSPADLQTQPGQETPMNFFVRFEFADAEAAQQMLDTATEGQLSEYKVGDKTYYGPNGGLAPPNLRLHLVNSNTFEVGTERYVLLESRNVITQTLANYWRQIPKDSALRFCFDVESNREVIDAIIEQAKPTMPPGSEEQIALINDLAGLSLAMDFDSDKLLTLRAEGTSEQGAEKIRKTVDGLLAAAQFLVPAQVDENLDPDSAAVVKKILSSLKATAEGKTIMIDIPKPEGFDEMTKRLNLP